MCCVTPIPRSMCGRRRWSPARAVAAWIRTTTTPLSQVVRSARDAYRQAGIDDPRTALSLAEVHDCFTPTEIVLMIGPVGVVEKLFGRTGLGFDDLELIELNEAFAVQVLAVLAGWGVKLDDVEDRLNVNGSGISLGHPIGATGCGSWPRCCTSCAGEAAAWRWRPCVSAAVKASPRSSAEPRHDRAGRLSRPPAPLPAGRCRRRAEPR
jgi:hypothetical protein